MKKFTEFKLNQNIYFGKSAINALGKELKDRKIKKVMMVAGGGSIKKNGAYDDFKAITDNLKIEVVEHWGVKPNPRHDDINAASVVFNKEKCEMIISVGGGSVADAAKGIVMAAANGNDIWPYATGTVAKNQPAPVAVVITLAATGSEANRNSIITNEETGEKRGLRDNRLIPVITIEDPTYSFTVDKWQTAVGSFDVVSHLLENYINNKPFEWTQNYILANIKTVIRNTYIALKEPENYDARANILVTSTFALNGITAFNDNLGSWDCHQLQYPYGAIWDVSHAGALAMITPVWMEHMKDRKEFNNRIVEFGKDIYGVDGFDETVAALKAMIKDWGLPSKATDFDNIKEVTEDNIQHMIKHILGTNKKFGLWDMTEDEVRSIYETLK